MDKKTRNLDFVARMWQNSGKNKELIWQILNPNTRLQIQL